MEIKIKNLRVKTIIGVNDWERETKQEVLINLNIEFDGDRAVRSDRIEDTINYRTVTKRIIEEVEKSNFFLLEKLADRIIRTVADEANVVSATVEVDKPGALRHADSVSVRRTSRPKR